MTANAADFAGSGCGRRYEKELETHFRDCLLFYLDGRIRFERYCYGEAACLVFSVWAHGFDADGNILWDREPEFESQKTAHHIFIKQSGKKLYSFQGIGSIGKLADRLRSTVSLENMGKCRRIINKRCPKGCCTRSHISHKALPFPFLQKIQAESDSQEEMKNNIIILRQESEKHRNGKQQIELPVLPFPDKGTQMQAQA